MPLSDYLVTDDLTILLGLISASLFLLHNLYKPQPLVHPILLGRQSDVARVRNPSESAVYRSYGTGMLGRLPMRPAKEVNVVADLARPELDAPRTLWNAKISNPQLRERVAAFGTGLLRLTDLQPRECNVLLLLNDSLEFLITDLALASHSIPSFTLSSLSLLGPVLERHPPSAIVTHVDFLPHLLELIYDSREIENHFIIVLGEPEGDRLKKLAGQIKLVRWEEVEAVGLKTEKIASAAPDPNGVFTVSFYQDDAGELQGAELTHENLTAGVAAARVLLPLSNAISPLDSIVSAHSLSTAFGRAIAFLAVYEGTSFATMHSTALFQIGESLPVLDTTDILSVKNYPLPFPTILFIKPAHLHSLTTAILKAARASLLFPLAWRHKAAGLAEGYLTKASLWDRIAFEKARQKVVGEGAGTIRGIVVSGGALEVGSVTPARIALSVPLVNSHIHPLVAGPVLASHPLDLQAFPIPPNEPTTDKDAFAHIAQVGPPSINVEVKLLGVDDAKLERGEEDPTGWMVVKGPPVGKVVDRRDDDGQVDEFGKEGWVRLGQRATVATNGTFKVMLERK